MIQLGRRRWQLEAPRGVPEGHWLGGARKYYNVLGEGLKSRSI